MSRPLGLRARATVAFGLLGLFAAVAVAGSTFLLARSYFLDRREHSAEQQAFANARLVRSALRVPDTDVTDLLRTIRGASDSDVVVSRGVDWFASSVAVGQDSIPSDLRRIVSSGGAGRQVVRSPQGDLRLVVGTPIAAVDGTYFEIFPLDELERSLGLLRNVLVGVTVGTVLVTAALGRFAAQRVVRPLTPVAVAAERIAGGDLRTRLTGGRDRDLEPLVASFNSMAAALQERVEREQRFTSDVSHELRSPLAAMRAAVEILERRRAALPDEVLATVDLLAARVESFEELVLDLLEISRLDAAAVELVREPLDARELVEHVLAMSGSTAPVQVVGDAPLLIDADRRRLAQALSNIVVNAARYAGGLTAVTLEQVGHDVTFLFDDEGPGIRPEERRAVLQRFARGSEGRRRGSGSGTGLGLALAVGHVAAHGGRIEVLDAPGGGARFAVVVPASERA